MSPLLEHFKVFWRALYTIFSSGWDQLPNRHSISVLSLFWCILYPFIYGLVDRRGQEGVVLSEVLEVQR